MFLGGELLFLFWHRESEEVRFLREIKRKSPPGILEIPLPATDEKVFQIAFRKFPGVIKEVVPGATNIYVIAGEGKTVIRYS
jgi:hypothetical protein